MTETLTDEQPQPTKLPGDFAQLERLYRRARLEHRALEVLSFDLNPEYGLLEPHFHAAWNSLSELAESCENAAHPGAKLRPAAEVVWRNRAKFRSFDQRDGDKQLGIVRPEPSRYLIQLQIRLLDTTLKQVRRRLSAAKHGVRPSVPAVALFTALVAVVVLFLVFRGPGPGYVVLSSEQGWGELASGRAVTGGPMLLGGRLCLTGLGTHARSKVEIGLKPDAKRLSGRCGLDIASDGRGTIICKIIQNNRLLFSSGLLNKQIQAAAFEVEAEPGVPVSLIVEDAGDGGFYDQADWCDLRAR